MRLAKKPSNINDLIEKVIDALGAQLVSQNMKLELKLEPNIEKVLFDPGRIEEVLNSIIQFIIKTPTPSGAKKECNISTRSRNNEVLMIDIFHSKFEFNNMEILELTNKNIQIEKFMQSDQDLQDLNLHFAFVNHVLKSHGGSFLVTSEANIGTYYRIEIPIV
jgi:light-regulated signal transduction histidine kinase (bacteriophytochrome)